MAMNISYTAMYLAMKTFKVCGGLQSCKINCVTASSVMYSKGYGKEEFLGLLCRHTICHLINALLIWKER